MSIIKGYSAFDNLAHEKVIHGYPPRYIVWPADQQVKCESRIQGIFNLNCFLDIFHVMVQNNKQVHIRPSVGLPAGVRTEENDLLRRETRRDSSGKFVDLFSVHHTTHI